MSMFDDHNALREEESTHDFNLVNDNISNRNSNRVTASDKDVVNGGGKSLDEAHSIYSKMSHMFSSKNSSRKNVSGRLIDNSISS
jgi:hypothetical protein